MSLRSLIVVAHTDPHVSHTVDQLDRGARHVLLASTSRWRPHLEADIVSRGLTRLNVIADPARPDDARAPSVGVPARIGFRVGVRGRPSNREK